MAKEQEARRFIFRGLPGCSNHSCVIKKPEGMGTNGPCHCFNNLSRAQLNLFGQRLDRYLHLLNEGEK